MIEGRNKKTTILHALCDTETDHGECNPYRCQTPTVDITAFGQSTSIDVFLLPNTSLRGVEILRAIMTAVCHLPYCNVACVEKRTENTRDSPYCSHPY